MTYFGIVLKWRRSFWCGDSIIIFLLFGDINVRQFKYTSINFTSKGVSNILFRIVQTCPLKFSKNVNVNFMQNKGYESISWTFDGRLYKLEIWDTFMIVSQMAEPIKFKLACYTINIWTATNLLKWLVIILQMFH